MKTPLEKSRESFRLIASPVQRSSTLQIIRRIDWLFTTKISGSNPSVSTVARANLKWFSTGGKIPSKVLRDSSATHAGLEYRKRYPRYTEEARLRYVQKLQTEREERRMHSRLHSSTGKSPLFLKR
jgi:hypothetical protein